MKVNESNLDRTLRTIAGVALLYVGLGTSLLAGTLGTVAAVIGAVLLLTGLVGVCPLYNVLKISTKK